VSQKNKVWVTDTTFIGTREGWLYFATVLSLYSRKIESILKNLTCEFV